MWAYGTKLCIVLYVCTYLCGISAVAHLAFLKHPMGPTRRPSFRKSFTTSEDNSPAGWDIDSTGYHGRDWSSKLNVFAFFRGSVVSVIELLIYCDILCIYAWSKSGFYAPLNILVTESKTYSGTTATVGWIEFWWLLSEVLFSLKDCYRIIPKVSHEFRLGEIMRFHHQPAYY